MKAIRPFRGMLLATLAAALFAAGTAGFATQSLRHGRVPPPGVGGAIDLVDQRGQAFGLQRLAGRPALLFFGFTRCASTCPVALSTARQLLAEAATPPAIVFVTLDPLSDGPRELGAFLGQIDSRLIGLTGNPMHVEQAAERYGVSIRSLAGGPEHSSMWYLLDGQGRVQRVYPHNTPAAHLMDDVRRLAAR